MFIKLHVSWHDHDVQEQKDKAVLCDGGFAPRTTQHRQLISIASSIITNPPTGLAQGTSHARELLSKAVMWARRVLAAPLTVHERPEFGKLAAVARGQRMAIVNKAASTSRAAWTNWAKEALSAAGASAAHAFIRKADRDIIFETRPSVIDQVEGLHKQWAQHWRATQPTEPQAEAPALPAAVWALNNMGWDRCDEFTQHVNPAAIIADSNKSKGATASAFDGLHCRHFSLLSDPLLEAAAVLMRTTLATGFAPALAGVVAVPLVPKADGVGLRPVGVFSALQRVLGAVVKDHSRAWESNFAGKSKHFCAGPGKHAADVVCRQAVGSQIQLQRTASAQGSSDHLTAIPLLTDIETLFDSMCFHHLQAAAQDHGFPRHLLRVALSAYRWPRRLRHRAWVSPPCAQPGECWRATLVGPASLAPGRSGRCDSTPVRVVGCAPQEACAAALRLVWPRRRQL